MADQPGQEPNELPQEGAPNPAADAAAAAQAKPALTLEQALAELNSTRAEAAKYRTELRAEKAKTTEFEREKMTEQERLKADLADLSPKAQRAEKLEAVLAKQLEAQRKDLPAHITAVLDKLDVAEQLDYLAEHGSAFRAPISSASPTNPARGGPMSIDSQIAAARAKADWREEMRLQRQKLATS